MIIAIINQSTPTGRVKIEEFRRANTVRAAVAAFCGEYKPKKKTSEYLGYAMKDGATLKPGEGRVWFYDFDASTPGLVAGPPPERPTS